ncbi:branched-chain amino acid ABC transporter ATP-binding protein (plasmid) [Azospirillum sp. TSH58]|uniref:ABC transporter ATP-binding protein n=1 Tax=Azospirillum sp. TSH58 TaxID=664962 RepID=UPI000D602CED|nr:ABC transporter ATP-binding protein [Azospirillum sp. TSH58]AWJ85769.1 branched-chain amino acid ABC transporter ATP-binding protein [Azospirillum sp. TSH58]PWC73317.1 leucine/isoleucine/valine transporter ATP-binding subunit [Azospirillum sp. TSH58]
MPLDGAQTTTRRILEVRDLTVRMGPQEILRGVSLDVAEGAIVAVLGANGVGKTTLMRALSGIYRTTGGATVFDGEDMTDSPSHEVVRRGLAQAPEGRQIFGTMTVRENLLLGGRTLRHDRAARMERMLELFPRLRERLTQKAGSLSGGEQQMLCIARALMSKPRLLLLDEPSLGLAPMVVKQIFDLLVQIRSEGTSILLVEQNARAALRVADHAYVMEAGRVTLSGSAADLAADPRVRAAYLGG